ncbi:restriction endonuclease [Streptomyces sp. NPDC007991]|uniref:restriction endonuclease n=1 Tax=Streptomyces sp. NPDC007991 TaxID=3364803 RepID=UPI0036EF7249
MTNPHRSSAASHIPWKAISGEVLEELVFQLVDAMGAKEVSWRSGGMGVTNSDGGRDIEATFYTLSPDDEPRRERWWMECKGRSATVPKSAVINATHNASAYASDVDRLVIVSNSSFSNPTVDWVDAWNSSPANLPKVSLWGREKLEIQIRKYPVAAARVVPDSIESSKRVELLFAYFTESGIAPRVSDLRYFWEHFSGAPEEIETPWLAMFAYSEILHGDLADRPWGVLVSNRSAAEVALHALVTLPMICATTHGLDAAKATAASSYLLQCVVCNLPPAVSSLIINDPFRFVKGKSVDSPEEWHEIATAPILSLLLRELGDACASDCSRIFCDLRALPEEPAGPQFWTRFGAEGQDNRDSVLIVEDYSVACAVGLPLGKERNCPLFVAPEEVTPELIEDLAHVIMARVERPSGRLKELVGDEPAELLNSAREKIASSREPEFRFQGRESLPAHLESLMKLGISRKLIKLETREIRRAFRKFATAADRRAEYGEILD